MKSRDRGVHRRPELLYASGRWMGGRAMIDRTMGRMLRGISIVAAFASIAACATDKGSGLIAGSAALRGMVYNENRTPVLEMKVSRVKDGSTLQTTLTDIHGRYVFPDVPYGPVTLQFEKGSYETLTWSFAFNAPTQVVYVRMSNLNELLDAAADLIRKRDWAGASSALERANKIETGNTIATFLEAQMLSLQGDPGRAADVLEKLSSEKDVSFAVELALADLYEEKLGHPEKALLHLKKALTVQDDLDIQSRVTALEKK